MREPRDLNGRRGRHGHRGPGPDARPASGRPAGRALGIAAIGALATGALVSACGRTARVESEPSVRQATTVQVSLDEYRIDMQRTIPAGPVTFRVRNAGTMEHNFEVEGRGVERSFPVDLRRGDTSTMTVDLSPGTYEVYCPVADHAQRGMRLSLTVTD